MKLYHYDDHGVLAHISPNARVDPEEPTDKNGAPRYLIPKNSTAVAPPDTANKAGLIPVFDGAAWVVAEDNRGDVWEKATGEKLEWAEPGALPPEYTKVEAPSQYHVWANDRWAPAALNQNDADLKRRKELREQAMDEVIEFGSVSAGTKLEFVEVITRLNQN